MSFAEKLLDNLQKAMSYVGLDIKVEGRVTPDCISGSSSFVAVTFMDIEAAVVRWVYELVIIPAVF